MSTIIISDDDSLFINIPDRDSTIELLVEKMTQDSPNEVNREYLVTSPVLEVSDDCVITGVIKKTHDYKDFHAVDKFADPFEVKFRGDRLLVECNFDSYIAVRILTSIFHPAVTKEDAEKRKAATMMESFPDSPMSPDMLVGEPLAQSTPKKKAVPLKSILRKTQRKMRKPVKLSSPVRTNLKDPRVPRPPTAAEISKKNAIARGFVLEEFASQHCPGCYQKYHRCLCE